ncbi:MAG: 3-hydroxybutyryl-CoA dehydrogenase [Melioribacteraceae bacterium]|nr:MAG: 3-hydroxybutyryl-CoA dehydrogenase [Melioribacteraceae bacterium]
MGSGIAQVAAAAGYKVVLNDVDDSILQKAKTNLEKTFAKLVEKNKYTKEKAEEILNHINYSPQKDSLKECGLIIEAVVENLEVKKNLFSELEKLISEKNILATNTSSLSVTAIASACVKSERVIGAHFFNPAPLMPLVEIVPGVQTSSEVLNSTKKLITKWGKVCVVAKDTPGFIVNRVARPFYGEALRILEEGIADAATIDYAMKEIGNFKMGPFELMDLIGNDVNYKVTETVFEQFYFDPRFKPSIIQKRLVEAKLFGRKTGKGFYDYSEDAKNPEPSKDENLLIEIFFRIFAMLVNEAADAVFMNIASKEDIDLAMTKGVNYPKGLLRWADERGIDKIVKRLNMLYEEYGEDRYRVNPLLKKMAKENKKFYA